MPLSLLFAFIPKRYLIGAAVLVALLISAVVAYNVHLSGIKDTYYRKGYGRATDSVSAIAIRRIAATETVYVKSAVRFDSQVVAVAHGHPAQHLVIQTVPVTVPDTELKVRVIVEAFHDTIENVPVRAAQYWKQADSTAGLALQSASQWHAAYLASDSVATLYAQRLRNATALPQPSHAKRDLVYAALGATLALVVRAQLHHR